MLFSVWHGMAKQGEAWLGRARLIKKWGKIIAVKKKDIVVEIPKIKIENAIIHIVVQTPLSDTIKNDK